jgi:nucleotide-binding universal stress UspA family protein
MYDSVLVPTDGSEMIDTTLEHGLQIAMDNDATVHALYVVDSRVARAAEDAREEVESSLQAEGEQAIEHVRSRVEDASLEATGEIRSGTPQKEILEYTDEHGIDLIAIGTHGKSPREKLLSMGSVTERVVDNASVPVLVVRDQP